jgi:hypothetical protein
LTGPGGRIFIKIGRYPSARPMRPKTRDPQEEGERRRPPRAGEALDHVDALYGKPAVAVATAGVEDGEGSALLGGENFIRQLGLSLKGRAVVRATFPGDAIVSAEGRSAAHRLATALVFPDDYASEGISCPECRGTYFEFSGYDRGVDPKNRTARVGEDRR